MKNVSDADMRTNLRLVSGNGDMSNNIIMHPSIAMGEEPHTRYLVTALWDWCPVASCPRHVRDTSETRPIGPVGLGPGRVVGQWHPLAELADRRRRRDEIARDCARLRVRLCETA